MKLEFQEVTFLKNAVRAVNISAGDAPVVAKVLDKIDKEYSRLEKLEQKKLPSNGVMEAAK